MGNYPLTKVQCEKAFDLLAQKCRQYNISPNNILTHYEFGKTHPFSTSFGKIYITYLPPYPEVATQDVGGFIRNQVRVRLGQQPVPVDIISGVEAVTGGAANIESSEGGSSSGRYKASMLPGGTFIKNPWGNMTPTSFEDSEVNNDSTVIEVDSGAINNKPLSFLKTTNDWLEKVPKVTTESLNNMIGTGENIAQNKVDDICAWLSYKVNVAVERKRQSLIRTLHEQYVNNQKGPLMKAANAISSFVSDPLEALGSFASAIFAPIQPVFDWLKILIKEVPRLAANLANIVSSLPPPAPNPQINFDKFKLKVHSFGLKEIIKGTKGMKAPEQMFPEPPDPFHHDTFAGLFGDESADLISGAFKYKLKPEDFETVLASIQQEASSDLLDNLSIESFSTSSTINEIEEAFHNGATGTQN